MFVDFGVAQNNVNFILAQNPPTTKEDLPALTGLRGLAALIVVFGHIFAEGVPVQTFPYLNDLSHFLPDMSVTFFFILSGFIMMHVYGHADFTRKKNWYLHFLFARFARIYPVYAVSILLMLLPRTIDYFTHSHLTKKVITPFEIVINFLLIQNWNSCLKFSNPLLTPAWALSAEWFAYFFLFGICLFIFLRIKQGWQYLAAAALPALISCVFYPLIFPYFHDIMRVTLSFMLGAALYGVRSAFHHFFEKYNITDLLAIGVGVLFLFQFQAYWIERISLITIGLLILGASFSGSMLYRHFSHPVWVWFGTLSYSLYITHWFVFQIFYHSALSTTNGGINSMPWLVANAILQTIACICFAIPIYYGIEQTCRGPVRAFLDGLINRSKS